MMACVLKRSIVISVESLLVIFDTNNSSANDILTLPAEVVEVDIDGPPSKCKVAGVSCRKQQTLVDRRCGGTLLIDNADSPYWSSHTSASVFFSPNHPL